MQALHPAPGARGGAQGDSAAWRARSGELLARGQWHEAHAVIADWLARHPDDVDALTQCGVALREGQQFEAALAPLNQAVERAPTDLQALFHRALTLRRLDRLAEAVADCDRLLAAHPQVPEAHFNRANLLQDLMLLPQAIEGYRRAIALSPDYAEAHCNLACTLLLAGDYAQGLAEYEWRWRASFIQEPPPDFAQPAWDGSAPLQDKTLLLYTEQGLGDTLQFVRHVQTVAARGARVMLQAPPPLIPLLKGVAGLRVLAPKGLRELPPFDLHCPLMSLPHRLGLRPPDLGWTGPYLRVQPDRIARWRPQIAQTGFRIGLCWQGLQRGIGPGKSFELAGLARRIALPGVTLYSLQKGPGSEQAEQLPAGLSVQRFDAGFDGEGAFLDSAAVIAQLDLVISADTAIAHLAGALGKPVWLLLKQVPDWRWGLQGWRTPWYPTMRLFRQAVRGDWQACFDAIGHELQGILALANPGQR